MALSSPHVSKILRDAGFPICQTRTGTGVRVSRSGLPGQVALEVTMPGPAQELRLADRLADWLDRRGAELGWAYERSSEESTIFRVWRPEDDPTALRLLAGTSEAPLQPRPLPSDQAARLHRDGVGGKLQGELNAATTRLRAAIYEGTAPAQADITAARTALAALIELAGGDQ